MLSNGDAAPYQTLTKLRFSRNTLTSSKQEKFKELLQTDDFYKIRLPSNVLSPPGRNYTVSAVKASCLAREALDEHFVIHMEGVNILAVNYGSFGACPYPWQLKFVEAATAPCCYAPAVVLLYAAAILLYGAANLLYATAVMFYGVANLLYRMFNYIL